MISDVINNYITGFEEVQAFFIIKKFLSIFSFFVKIAAMSGTGSLKKQRPGTMEKIHGSQPSQEAAGSIPEAFVEITTARRANIPFIVITVINSSRKNPFSNPQGTLATSKSDKRRHGFSIKSIRKTVSKYQGDIKMY